MVEVILQQEKIEAQRGRLPVQALEFSMSIPIILGLTKTAGVHFLLRPHDSLGNLETAVHGEMRFVDKSAFYGYIRESWYFWMDKLKWEIYFHNSLGIKWHMLSPYC